MINRTMLAGVVLVAAAIAALGLYLMPIVYGFLIMAGWIGR
jgi:hypothetical protein